MRHLILMSALLGLTACTTTGTGDRYTREFDQLTADCRDRGGILTPTVTMSGRPQNDNVCKITGQPSGRIGN